MTTNHRGFTLLEVLIALIIASMGTVTLGYFTAAIVRHQTASEKQLLAVNHLDRTLKLVVLNGQIDHPTVSSAIAEAREDNISIKLRISQTPLTETARVVTATADNPVLSKPIQYIRFVQLQSNQTGDNE